MVKTCGRSGRLEKFHKRLEREEANEDGMNDEESLSGDVKRLKKTWAREKNEESDDQCTSGWIERN